MNAYWFLKTLFFAAVICFVLLKYIKKGRWIIVGVMLALAGCCQLVEFDKTAMLSRLFLACAFYLTGNLFARGEYKISIPVAALSLCAVIAVSFFFRESIFVQGWKVIIYYPVALLGIYGVFGLSRALDKADGLARILDFVGRSSLTIMTFHFLSFKLASLLEVLIDKVPAEQMADFPYIHAHSAQLWPLYSLVGIVLPVLIYCLKNRVYPRQNSLIRLF